MPFRVRSALPLATEGTQECLWNLAYDERRMAIVLELTVSLEEEAISDLCCQFPIPADYDGEGSKGSKFVFYLVSAELIPSHHGWGADVAPTCDHIHY